MSRPANDYRGLALVSTAVVEVVVPVLVGVWLDNRFGWSPWAATVGAVLGVSVSIVHLVMISRGSGDA